MFDSALNSRWPWSYPGPFLIVPAMTRLRQKCLQIIDYQSFASKSLDDWT